MIVKKGCADLGIKKGMLAEIVSVEPMGLEFSNSARVKVRIGRREYTLWARHANRVQDPEFNLNNGSPELNIRIAR